MFEEAKNSSCLQDFYTSKPKQQAKAELTLGASLSEGQQPMATTLQLIAVTDAASCPRSLAEQVERLALCEHKPHKLILRAKELDAAAYRQLAQEVFPLCQRHDIQLIIHSHWKVAIALGVTSVHMPLALLAQMPAAAKALCTATPEQQQAAHCPLLSTSVHSIAEAEQALALGANTLIAGHIYATNCKAGVPPRGVAFLRSIYDAIVKHTTPTNYPAHQQAAPLQLATPQQILPSLTLYAIGGIGFEVKQWLELKKAGAAGACIMSAYMQL